MIERNEKAYWTKEVADRLRIGYSTLRKYCLHLEAHGYHFTKGQRGSRAFLESDIQVLTKMRDVLNRPGTTFNEAVAVALEERGETGAHAAITREESSDEQESYRLQIATAFQIAEQLLEGQKEELLQIVREEIGKEVREMLVQQEAFNRELLEKLEEQQRFIDEKLEKRDQMLMESIRETQEFRKESATASKKGFLARLFGK